MKLAKLFLGAALAVLAMAFVACEPNNVPVTPPDEPTPEEPKTETYLELTSPDVMEFAAEGGVGEITWQEKEHEVSRTDPYVGAVTTEAVWITLEQTTTGYGSTSFVVAANEGEAREAKIVITYHEQVIEVVVKQAAAPVEPTELAYAVRLSSEEIGVENNIFAIMFADDAESVEVGIMLIGKKGVEVLEEGVYNAYNGNFVVEESGIQTYVDGEIEAGYIIEDGEVEVSLDGEIYTFDIAVITSDGYEFNFAYTGVVEGMVQESEVVEPVAFTPACVKAERYMIGNFFLQLYIDDTRYHELDMYDEMHPNDDLLSAGTYTYAAEAISTWSTFSTGYDQTCALSDAEITLVHNEDNTTTITGYIKSEEGDHITIDWTGVIEGFIYERETGETFTVEALSAKVEYDKVGQKDILFMVDEFSGHKFSFMGEALEPGKPLADGDYSSENGTIDIAYSVHGYGAVYGDMTSAKATVVNDLEAGTTSFDVEWEFEGNTYQLAWSGAVEGITYKEVVGTTPLDFEPVYVEMVRISSKDRYFYFYDSEENELVCELYNDKILMPYINYEGAKLDISTEDYIFEFDDKGLNRDAGVRGYNVRFVTLDGRVIEFTADLYTYVD